MVVYAQSRWGSKEGAESSEVFKSMLYSGKEPKVLFYPKRTFEEEQIGTDLESLKKYPYIIQAGKKSFKANLFQKVKNVI
jgi:hypothetical protein